VWPPAGRAPGLGGDGEAARARPAPPARTRRAWAPAAGANGDPRDRRGTMARPCLDRSRSGRADRALPAVRAPAALSRGEPPGHPAIARGPAGVRAVAALHGARSG